MKWRPVRSRVGMVASCALMLLAWATGGIVCRAETVSLAITTERLRQVFQDVKDGRVFEAVDVESAHIMRGVDQGPLKAEAGQRAPFQVFLATPYTRAVFSALDARQRYLDPPALSAAQLNADGVVVSVFPGQTLTTAQAIEDVLVKQLDGSVVRPVKKDVQPDAPPGAIEASRVITRGVFYFPLAAFEHLPVTVICVGAGGNFSLEITSDDLKY
jgi:hypothetical protein